MENPFRRATWTLAKYERVSSERQEKEETIETQDFYLDRHVQEGHHLVYGDPYRDINVSQSVPLPQRPGFQRLLADARLHRFERVACQVYDRWSRTFEIYREGYRLLQQHGVDIYGLDIELRFGTPEEVLMSRSLLASKEYVMAAQLVTMQKGRHRQAQLGNYPGGPVDFGYALIPVRPKGSTFAVHEEQALIVRDLYQDVGWNRVPCPQVAHRLNLAGVPIPSQGTDCYRGKGNQGKILGKWRPQMIAKLLHKTCYKGYKYYGASRIEMPPLVSEETWERAQQSLREHRKESDRGARHDYLLSGRIVCGACQRAMTGRPGVLRKDGTHATRYYCQGASDATLGLTDTACPVRSFGADALEAAVWERLQHHLARHEQTMLRLVQSSDSEEEHQQRLTRDRERLLEARDEELRLRDCLARGKNLQGWSLEPAHAETLYHETAQKVKDLDAEIDAAHQHLLDVGERERVLNDTAAHLRYWHSRINADLTFHTRQHLVRLFVERVEVYAGDEEERDLWFKVWFRFDRGGVDPEQGRKGGERMVIDARTSRSRSINYHVIETLSRVYQWR